MVKSVIYTTHVKSEGLTCTGQVTERRKNSILWWVNLLGNAHLEVWQDDGELRVCYRKTWQDVNWIELAQD